MIKKIARSENIYHTVGIGRALGQRKDKREN